MNGVRRLMVVAGFLVLLFFTAGGGGVVSNAVEAPAGDEPGLVRVGMLVYGQGKSAACFADAFLTLVDRQTSIRVSRRFEPVELGSDGLFEHPFVVMAGKGLFVLPEGQVKNLRAYLLGGGFVLASAGCSDGEWSAGFREALRAALPEYELEPVGMDHAVFHTLYQIDRVVTKKAFSGASVWGLEIDGRLAVVFSPTGLHDSARAGPGCCCCGGNEVRNASEVNANVLVYALTH